MRSNPSTVEIECHTRDRPVHNSISRARLDLADGPSGSGGGDRDVQLVEQPLDAGPDLVTDRAHRLDALARRVVQRPVLVALAREDRADVPAAHRDHDVGRLHSLGGQHLGALGPDVDAHLEHRLDRDRVDPVRRKGAGGPDLDGSAGQLGQEARRHLGTSGVVHADEQDAGAGRVGHAYILTYVESLVQAGRCGGRRIAPGPVAHRTGAARLAVVAHHQCMTPTAQGAAITDAPVVIVGGGLAGATVATTLREEGFTGPVVLLAGEPNRPYERPPLSKGYLLGTDERESAFVHPLTWYAENDIDLRLGTRVTVIDRPVQEVVLGDGSRLRYRDLVLATGSVPRTLEVPGADLAGVRYLRGLEDAEAWRPALGRRLRTEHWANARRQGAVAARSIMGADASDDRLPYFYTDQYDLGMEYVGYVGPDGYDELVVRGDLAKRELIAFWLREGRVLAGMNVNVWDVTEQIEELIRSGGRVDDRSWPVG